MQRTITPLLFTLLAAGCGQKNSDVADVTGTISSDGQPVAGAEITFTPISGGRGSMGRSSDDGSYDLLHTRDTMGARIGKHKVSISVPPPAPAGMSPEEIERMGTGVPVEVFTQDNVDVVAGANTLDFSIPAEDLGKAEKGGQGDYGR